MRKFLTGLGLLILTVPAVSLSGAAAAMADNLSKPVYTAPKDTIPAPRDIAYGGVMKLLVDARDVRQGVFRVRQTIPVAKSGRLTLLYPEWLPGNHAPRGEIEKLAGLSFTANSAPLRWQRDDMDVYAFHVDVPKGVNEVTANFDFVSATSPIQGRVVMAPNMLNLRWHAVSLYPAGYYTRQIPVEARAIYPDGWQAASALKVTKREGNQWVYEATDYDTLVDSPVFAGRYFLRNQLTGKVGLNIVADAPEYLKPTSAQIAPHAKLVREAEALFGSTPYDRYEFLLALTEDMGGIGIEHHRSSENGVNREYFTDWDSGPGRRNLLPHEVVHAWNGKYRRPADMWTPDFRTPVRPSLLWIYEGQTQLWGYVLGARSGLFSKEDTLDGLAAIAADMDLRKGRMWRPLIDTTLDPIIAARRPKPWTGWQRSEDYYNEGLLIWLEVDGILRRETAGKKSLDDFARAFFKGKNGDWGVVTYDLNDVIAALNRLAPYDWDGLFDQRVMQVSNEAPKAGLELGGYRLVWSETPSRYILSDSQRRKQTDFSYSIGVSVDKGGKINEVEWDSPAFRAGLKTGITISAVNGKAFTVEILSQAIRDNKDQAVPIEIFAKTDEKYESFKLDYSGGLRYPRLEKITEGEGGIDILLKPQVK
jgi:predicted metalloprotease with PDZ domain